MYVPSITLSSSSFITQHYAALRSTTQHYAALRSTTQHYAALHSTTQHYAALRTLRSSTQHHAAPRSTTQHHAAPRSTTQHHAAPRSTIQYHPVAHNLPRCCVVPLSPQLHIILSTLLSLTTSFLMISNTLYRSTPSTAHARLWLKACLWRVNAAQTQTMVRSVPSAVSLRSVRTQNACVSQTEISCCSSQNKDLPPRRS